MVIVVHLSKWEKLMSKSPTFCLTSSPQLRGRRERNAPIYARKQGSRVLWMEIIGLDPLGVDKSLGYEVVVEGYFGVLIAVGVVLLSSSSRNGK